MRRTVHIQGVAPVASRQAPEPPRPEPVLPNPGVCTNGQKACNVPLVVGGVKVGYCTRLVWGPGEARWWRLPPGTHKGPHRIEWGT